jgi:hypothetical protein
MAQDSSLPGFWDTRYREGVTPWDAGGVPPQLRRELGPFAHLVKKVDFFSFATASHDVVYERAFLCALPRRRWPQRGPPFGISQMRLDELLRPFFTLEGCADIPPAQSIPVFKRKECWQVWRRKL